MSVAIVGMACVFPGARDLGAFRDNLARGADAITEVPPARWDPVFYDPADPTRLYCRRGGFIDDFADFDALGFGVMPVAASSAEPDQLLSLEVAARALRDAGIAPERIAGTRAAVILGRGGYQTAGMTRLFAEVRGAEELALCLRGLVPGISPAQLAAVKAAYQAELGARAGAEAIGLVPNLAASRIANRLDLAGPAYTVDAACASSLVAVDHAVRELESGRCDLVLAGGVHLVHDVTFWSVFCRLGAMSRRQQIRPFDRRADGLLVGEGVGIVVLRRLADAERDGDRIYAVIRGTGVRSDGRETSLVTPRVEGQVAALEDAWRAAGLDPASVGFVEAHGTATPAGDLAELTTLARVFGAPEPGRPRAALGAVKSMIGHAMPAAGIAGLIKAALATHEGVLFPSLHCEEPHERLAETRFRAVDRAEPWEGSPRRAGVNAFGFGGINAHVVLEEHAPRTPRRPSVVEQTGPSLLAVAAEGGAALLAALDAGKSGGDGPCRLALTDPTEARLEQARAIVARGQPRRGRDGIFFSPEASAGRIALLFPGVEAAFSPQADDVARHFGLTPLGPVAEDLESRGHGIVALGRLLAAALERLGVRPDFIAGHSIGEWTGMMASRLIPEGEIDAFLDGLPRGSLEVPGVVFAAVGCGAGAAREAAAGLTEIAVSHDNCPHQSILCGREESVAAALERLRAQGVLSQKLPFRSGFHSPLFASYLGPHRERVARLPLQTPAVPLWSATTCAPYPADPAAVRALVVEHLVQPVRFRETILALYAAGARIFLQLGLGSLVSFVEDTLRGRPHLALAAHVPQRSGMEQLARVAAALFAEGVPVDLSALPRPSTARARLRLALGVPLVRLEKPLDVAPRPTLDLAGVSDPVIAEFQATMRRIAEAQEEVLRAWQQSAPRTHSERRRLSVEALPELLDHCFFRQPEGWASVPDRYPVVPMTTSIAWAIEAARALVPGRVVTAVEEVRATRWIAVAPPLEVEISAVPDGADHVEVKIAGYLEATVLLGAAYPAPPPPALAPLADEGPAPVDAAGLYRERWMFHGPAFQGVEVLGPMGSRSIRGVLRALPAPGALLDNAGQLLGYLVMVHAEIDRLAMPVRVGRLRFFGPDPAPGTRVACAVQLSELGPRDVRADLELSVEGRLWARIDAWEDRRFESDATLWDVLQHPEHHLLAEPQPEGYVWLEDRWRSAQARDFIARRYLGERERATYEALPLARQRSWLAGRIAAKDAARDWLWRHGHGPVFPVEIAVESTSSGRPVLRVPGGHDLRVSLAHKGDVAVAKVALGTDVGIDVERAQPRPESFEATALTDAERCALPTEGRDLAVTRLWAAKEAAGKALGTGLAARPRALEVTEIEGDRLRAGGAWIRTRAHGDYVVAWTET